MNMKDILIIFMMTLVATNEVISQDCKDVYSFDICKEALSLKQCPYFTKTCTKTCQLCLSNDVYWSSWTHFGPCSRSCRSGQTVRYRTCLIEGMCVGPKTETKRCRLRRCRPVMREPIVNPTLFSFWSPWSPFGGCSKSCGVGHMKRIRYCFVVGFCSSEAPIQYRHCNVFSCPHSDDGNHFFNFLFPSSTTTPYIALNQDIMQSPIDTTSAIMSTTTNININIPTITGYSSTFTTTAPTTTSTTTSKPTTTISITSTFTTSPTITTTPKPTTTTTNPTTTTTPKPTTTTPKPTTTTPKPTTTTPKPTTTTPKPTTTTPKPTTTTTNPTTTTPKPTTTTPKPTTITPKPTTTTPKPTTTTTKPTTTTPKATTNFTPKPTTTTSKPTTTTPKSTTTTPKPTTTTPKPTTTTPKLTTTTPKPTTTTPKPTTTTKSTTTKPITTIKPTTISTRHTITTTATTANTTPSSIWSSWGEFNSCSVTCGVGRETRWRECSEEGRCVGENVEERTCRTNTACPELTWSSCSKTCGQGTQYKFVSTSCINQYDKRCLKDYRHCNTQSCVGAICDHTQQERRKGIPHACCESEIKKLESSGARVFGGFVAKTADWPWMVYLEINNEKICGGTIIGLQWVVTAAHCMFSSRNQPITPDKIVGHVGITKRSQSNRKNEVKFVQIIKHEHFFNVQNDIALLKLKEFIQFSSQIRPISLPNNEETPTDTICYTTGWGITDKYSFMPSDDLMEVGLFNLPYDVCVKAYHGSAGVSFIKTSQKLLCVGNLDRQLDTCVGDSGGPLVCQRCRSCDWYLAGIISFGADECGKKGVPGMYTKVSAYEKWIRFHVSNIPITPSWCPYNIGP